jgi:hypothetical protein
MTARELVNRISLLDMVKQLGDRLTVGQRTLTPPVLVRIQVPQPIDLVALFSISKRNIQAQSGARSGVFVLDSSFLIAASARAGSR